MYHQHQQRQQLQHLSSRPSIPPEKHYLQQGGGDSGLVLSTDAKPRLKWTPELHERFLEAVNQLGGPDKATPKTIMRFMGIPGLTLYHLKSHLQKYRLSKSLQAQANAVHAKNVLGCRTATDKPCEGNGSPAGHLNLEPQINRSVHISEALHMQIEVQRRLHEQLEVQRHLQLRIEAQGKYLQSVLEKAQEALAKQSVDADGDVLGLQAAAAASNTQRRGVSELTGTATAERVRHHRRQLGAGDGSVDSCVTACEVSLQSQRDHDMLSIGLSPPFAEAPTSCEEEYLFLREPSRARAVSSDERRAIRRDGFRTADLDLNINDANASRHRSCGKIDLNGSSWN